MIVTEFQPRNPGVCPDKVFVVEPAATLLELEFLAHPIHASGVRQVQVPK